jgi:hypothetical protein
MNYKGAEVDMTGTYNLGFELFETHKDLNSASQSLSLNGDVSRMMGPILPDNSTLRFSEVIYDAPFLPNFQSAVTPSPNVTTGGVSTPRTDTFRNVFGISESSPISARTGIHFSYQNTYTRYQDPSFTDSQTNDVSMGLSHTLSRTNTLSADADYSRFDPYGGGPSFTYGLRAGDRHDFSQVLTGSISLGAGAVVLPDLNQPQYTWIGNLSISRKINERLQMSFQAGRDFNNNSGFSTVLIEDSATVSLNQQVTQFLSATASLNAARNYSFGLKTSTGYKTDIYSQDVGLGLNYQIATWLVGSLDYNYNRQEAVRNPQGDLIRNQYSFNLRARWS